MSVWPWLITTYEGTLFVVGIFGGSALLAFWGAVIVKRNKKTQYIIEKNSKSKIFRGLYVFNILLLICVVLICLFTDLSQINITKRHHSLYTALALLYISNIFLQMFFTSLICLIISVLKKSNKNLTENTLKTAAPKSRKRNKF